MKTILLILAALLTTNLSAQQVYCTDSQEEPCLTECHSPLLKSAPALPSENDKNLIYNSDKIYVYRLAVCISPEVMANTFQNDKTKANKWLDDLYAKLNYVYKRDLSIRFDEVRDERLLLFKNETGFALTNSNGTKIIDSLIGTDKYDIGILIIETQRGQASGMASHGGAGANTGKANAYAVADPYTVAHELGHLFGARHIHICKNSFLVEPGKGQSIMSYGVPQNFFALPSMIEIRQQLSEQNYYLDASRNPNNMYTGNSIEEHDNNPYVEDAGAANVKLNHKAIRDEYVVTLNTRFQLYVPTVGETSESILYAAHPFDVGIGEDINKVANTCMPAYEAQKYNAIMFQPYYDEPLSTTNPKKENKVIYSDDYRIGTFTFLLGAYDRGRYDTHKTRVKIVAGEQFAIKSNIRSEYNGGEPITIQWNTCQELYGPNSKVRILLSDDFGKSYKYILADDVPNNGNWKGYIPFIKIGKVNYRNLSQPINGGVIKIEVKGEAAYAVSHEIPYSIQYDVIYTGGFTCAGTGKWVLFKDAPASYLVVKSKSQVPPMQPLTAYKKNSPSTTETIQGIEEHEGNLIRRTWLSTKLGSTAAYTQIIVVETPETAQETVKHSTAENLRPIVKDLLTNLGAIGYPMPNLPCMEDLKKTSSTVYDENYAVKANITAENVAKIEQLIDQISKLSVKDIIKPTNGSRYTLRNYRSLFGKDVYFYAKQRPEIGYPDPFVDKSEEATEWTCVETGGKYKLTANGKDLYMQIFNSNGSEFTLERGCTWGAFTLVNNLNQGAQLRNDGIYLSVFDYNTQNPNRQYLNSTYSSDFQFVPVNTVGGIEDITTPESPIRGVYTITGIRLDVKSLEELPAGIYIVDGKKTIIR